MALRKDNKGRVLRSGEYQRTCDSKYVYGYTDFLGKRKYIYSKDLKELREREAKLVKNQMDGIDIYVSGKADINYLFDRYISIKTNLRSNTYANYTYMYNHFVRDTFGKKIVGSVKYSEVLQFYLYLLNEKNLAIGTVDTIHRLLYPSFELAVRDDIIRKNPCQGIMGELKRQTGKKAGVREALTIEQQRAFLNYVKDHKVFGHWNAFMTFLFGTGCRIGEAIAVRWEDVNFKDRYIDINHDITYSPRADKDNKSELRVSDVKTNAGHRQIPMADRVYEILSELYDVQSRYGFSTFELDGYKNFVFTNRLGNVHNPSTVNRAIERIRTSYNAEEVVNAAKEHREPVIIPHFSCHHIRHTFCTRLCETESNLNVIQDIMGHADIQTTMNIYADATIQAKNKAMRDLSDRALF